MTARPDSVSLVRTERAPVAVAALPAPERVPVLVVDDDEDVASLIEAVLYQEGYEVALAEGVSSALEALRGRDFAALFLDLRLPDGNGLDLLARLRSSGSSIPTVVVTAFADLDVARRAMRLGVRDLLVKPFKNADLRSSVGRCAPPKRLGGSGLLEAMGHSPAVVALDSLVSRVASSDFSVLVTGETGTGKELVSRALHERSPRRNGPFVAVDCGSLPETLIESELFGHERGAFTGADRRRAGRFERASGGTLLLDEIENLPPSGQARLLRILQEHEVERLGGESSVEVDVRIVAATNASLEALTDDGTFRPDLFHRLAEVVVELPPLRDRREDVPYLAERFLAEARLELGRAGELAEGALDILEAHDWPGNVRELRNVVRRALLLAPCADIRADALSALVPVARMPPTASARGRARSLRTIAQEAERTAIVEVLARCHGNKSEVARQLGCDWKTLASKCRAYGLGLTGTRTEVDHGRTRKAEAC